MNQRTVLLAAVVFLVFGVVSVSVWLPSSGGSLFVRDGGGDEAEEDDDDEEEAGGARDACELWAQQPPPPRNHRFLEASARCGQAAYIQFHPLGGLGHRMDNFMNALMVSAAFGVPLALSDGFEVKSAHQALDGALAFFGIGAGLPLVSHLRNNRGWKYQMWSYAGNQQLTARVIAGLSAPRPCDTVFGMNEFWSHDRSPARWIMARTFQQRMATTATPSLFDVRKFAFAIHLRYGAASLDSVELLKTEGTLSTQWIIDMTRQARRELDEMGVPNQVYFFTAGSAGPNITAAFPDAVFFGPNTTVLQTFQHFVTADMVLCTTSSLCWSAAITSRKPLFLNPFPTREQFFFNPCPRGMPCTLVDSNLQQTASLSEMARSQIRAAADRWLVARSLKCSASISWPEEEDTPEQDLGAKCDIWRPAQVPRLLLGPKADAACVQYGFVPLFFDGKFEDNAVRWISGLALASALNISFAFGGRSSPGDFVLERELGLAHNIPCDRSFYELARVPVTLQTTKAPVPVSALVKRFNNITKKACGVIYEFSDFVPQDFGWASFAFASAVQRAAIRAKWHPTLWSLSQFAIVVAVGSDSDVVWANSLLHSTMNTLQSAIQGLPFHVVFVLEQEIPLLSISKLSENIRCPFDVVQLQAHGVVSAFWHMSNSDVTLCAGSSLCRTAALGSVRPMFYIRAEAEDANRPFPCPTAALCAVLGDGVATTLQLADLPGIAERWSVANPRGCNNPPN